MSNISLTQCIKSPNKRIEELTSQTTWSPIVLATTQTTNQTIEVKFTPLHSFFVFFQNYYYQTQTKKFRVFKSSCLDYSPLIADSLLS